MNSLFHIFPLTLSETLASMGKLGEENKFSGMADVNCSPDNMACMAETEESTNADGVELWGEVDGVELLGDIPAPTGVTVLTTDDNFSTTFCTMVSTKASGMVVVAGVVSPPAFDCSAGIPCADDWCCEVDVAVVAVLLPGLLRANGFWRKRDERRCGGMSTAK